jgi:hypothetical protein
VSNTLPTLDALRGDFHLLDGLQESAFPQAEVVMHEDFPPVQARRLDPPPESAGILAHLGFAWQLLSTCGRKSALLLNQVDRFAALACILNGLNPLYRRKIVLYDVFIDTPSPLKRWMVRRMVKGATLNVLFSRRQVEGYARLFGLPESRFAYIPYQSSHSKRPPVEIGPGTFTVTSKEREHTLVPGSYIFSGGNSARDYRTLCEAVRGTGVKVIVTTTDPRLFAGVDLPKEIEVLPVREPDFTRLMAGSRFVIMTLTAGRVRGFGEQTILNSWWHRRAVVVADDVSAQDYVQDGVNGYRLEPGDASGLRARILELWNDPARAAAMGQSGHESVRRSFTHEHFTHRMKMITLALAAS